MKHGTTQHPKTLELSSRLAIPRHGAAGLLACLWEWAREYCPAGDVGRYSNAVIARSISWDGDANELIEALTLCRWLDHDETYRLIIHDWWDHCEDRVHLRLARARQFFVNGQAPNIKRLSEKEAKPIREFYAEHAHGVRTAGAQQAHVVRTESAHRAHDMHTESAQQAHVVPTAGAQQAHGERTVCAPPRPRPRPIPKPAAAAANAAAAATRATGPPGETPPESNQQQQQPEVSIASFLDEQPGHARDSPEQAGELGETITAAPGGRFDPPQHRVSLTITQRVQPLAGELCQAHFRPGSEELAVRWLGYQCVQKFGLPNSNTNSVGYDQGIREWCKQVRDAFPAFVERWRALYEHDRRVFVPTVWWWVKSAEYESPPEGGLALARPAQSESRPSRAEEQSKRLQWKGK